MKPRFKESRQKDKKQTHPFKNGYKAISDNSFRKVLLTSNGENSGKSSLSL